jgi:putative ABC transport system permease protein
MLTLIYALLGLTGIIAVASIVNTLSLSVLERTREIGLPRAVGLTARQAKRMIRAESVLISLIGAALGLSIGVGLGVPISAETSLIEVVAIPWRQVALCATLAVLAGVLEAIWPARRAARLDVLRAITTEWRLGLGPAPAPALYSSICPSAGMSIRASTPASASTAARSLRVSRQ